MAAPTEQRVSTAQCARCRKDFSPGDRVVQLLIVEKVAKNPMAAWERGAMLCPDFELAHLSCADPGLNGMVLVPS